jgi:hypothetical protein
MLRPLQVLTYSVLLALPAAAQKKSLLEHMVGHWVLQGTIAGKATTHDVDMDWVLNREYVRIHEVSREKDAEGRPAYEAFVFIGKDTDSEACTCLWLDNTGGGGLSAQGLGHGTPTGTSIPFVFRVKEGQAFHNTFTYDAAADSWRWFLDNDENGKMTPFARVTLTRK